MHRECFLELIKEGLAGKEAGQKCPFCRSDDYVGKFAAIDQIMNETNPNMDMTASAGVFFAKISAAMCESDTRVSNNLERKLYNESQRRLGRM